MDLRTSLVAVESVRDSFSVLSRPAPEATSKLLHGDETPPRTPAGPRSIFDAVQSFLARLDDDDSVRLPLGIPRFDRATRGIEPGELVIELGRTASGKTMFLLNQVRWLVHGHPDMGILIVEAEMPRAQLIRRLFRMELGLNDDELDHALEHGRVDLDAFTTRYQNVYFIDEGSVALSAIERQAEDLAKSLGSTNLRVLFIDHAGLVRGERTASAYERASATAVGLKQLARRLDVAVFAIVQANRAGKTDGEPVSLESARDSGCFEENADFVIGFSALVEPRGEQPFVKMRLQKNRRGPSVPAVVSFDPASLRMAERDEVRHGE